MQTLTSIKLQHIPIEIQMRSARYEYIYTHCYGIYICRNQELTMRSGAYIYKLKLRHILSENISN